MRFRTHKFSSTVIYAVALAGFMVVIFAMTNAGIDPRAGHYDFDATGAATVCFGLLGLYHAIAIIFFDEDDSASADIADETGQRIPTAPDSYTGFIRQPWYKVFSVGPVFAAFCAASVLFWHSFAEYPGSAGTVWGDYTVSPLPALTVFLACWSATNIGFTFAAIAEAFNRDSYGLFLTFMILMFAAAIGIGIWFFAVPDQPVDHLLPLLAVVFPLSLLTSVGTRAWAVVRVARCDAKQAPFDHRTQQSQLDAQAPDRPFNSRPQSPPADLGSTDPEYSRRGGPPFDMLEPGEEVLLVFRSERNVEPQMLIATNKRFVRASILAPARTYVLEQASPGQLTGASTQRVGPDLMTVAHFRDRQDMRIIGGDPIQSQSFAEAVNRLADTGRVHR